MALLIVYLVIVLIVFSIAFTLLAVLIRRFYMKRKYRLLDLERERYAHLDEKIRAGEPLPVEMYKKKKGSFGWIAIEEALFRALDAADDKTAALRHFEELGFADSYIGSLYSGNKWEKALAAKKLGRIGCKKAVPHLVAVLKDDYRDVRNIAVYSLGLILDESALPKLIERLKQVAGSEEEVSLTIVKSSIIAFGPSAIPYLAVEVKDPSWKVRSFVLDILGEIASENEARIFTEALEDPEQDIRAKACKGLGRLKYRSSLPLLIKALSDPFWVVRLHAARALGLINDPFAIEALKLLLKDANWQVRKVVSESLGLIGRCAYTALLQVYMGGADRYAKEQSGDEIERSGIMKEVVMLALADGHAILFKKIGENADMKDGMLGNRWQAGPDIRLTMIKTLNALSPDEIRNVLESFSKDEFSAEEIEKAAFTIARLTI